MTKDRSPFTPGQPVPLELFVGRRDKIERVLRGARQVVAGKQENLYVAGEYGIGKSSFAAFTRRAVEKETGLAGFHVTLGGANTVERMIEQVIARMVERAHQEDAFARVRQWLSKYVRGGGISLFGVHVDLERVRRDAPSVAHGFLPFLREACDRVADTHKGLFLILDDLNGIAAEPRFAALIKGVVDEIAVSGRRLPLLLMLAGTEERRQQMIQCEQGIARIFEVVDIDPLPDAEVRDFFLRAFDDVNVAVEPDALDILTRYSGGLPKLMHEVGDATFWPIEQPVVTRKDALLGVMLAADNVGRKYFEPIHRALRSPDYRSILRKIGRLLSTTDFDGTFRRGDAIKGLTAEERKKLDNFLQRMKRLNALQPGENPGEWGFPNRLIAMYLWLQSIEQQRGSSRQP